MRPRRKRQLLAALAAALVASPYAFFLLASGYPIASLKFAAALLAPMLVVGILSAAALDIAARCVRQTPFGLMLAGWISATVTCLLLVLPYSLVISTRHEPWFSTFVPSAYLLLRTFWRVPLIEGALVGWIASTKPFSL